MPAFREDDVDFRLYALIRKRGPDHFGWRHRPRFPLPLADRGDHHIHGAFRTARHEHVDQTPFRANRFVVAKPVPVEPTMITATS